MVVSPVGVTYVMAGRTLAQNLSESTLGNPRPEHSAQCEEYGKIRFPLLIWTEGHEFAGGQVFIAEPHIYRKTLSVLVKRSRLNRQEFRRTMASPHTVCHCFLSNLGTSRVHFSTSASRIPPQEKSMNTCSMVRLGTVSSKPTISCASI